MTRYILGVDIGNTKSHALICSEQGQALGIGIAGPGNHEWLGKEKFYKVLSDVIHAAVKSAEISINDIAAAGYGVAGYDWSEDLPLMQEVIAMLDFDAPYGLMNDSGMGLLAGSTTGWGVSVSSGTSANARGRDAKGREARITGNGLLFDEYGGGHEMVYRAIQAISRAWSMRGPQTQLSELFVEQVGAIGVEDFLAGIARDRYSYDAKQASLVFQALDAGDEVARDIILWLAHGLSDLACGIIRQLEIEQEAFEVVLSGSIYKGSPLILETMRAVVCQLAPKARFVHLEAPPVTGAVILGMEQLGLNYEAIREHVIKSTEELLANELNKDE